MVPRLLRHTPEWILYITYTLVEITVIYIYIAFENASTSFALLQMVSICLLKLNLESNNTPRHLALLTILSGLSYK